MSAKVGNVAFNTSTGNQAVTGVGFQPKIVLFLFTENTVDGIIVDHQISLGAGISSTERTVAGVNDEDAQTTTDAERLIFDTKCLSLSVPGSSTILIDADLVSLDADGFTINVTTASGTASRFGYLALAGDDLTNVATALFSPSGSTGEQAVTGVGFQADAIMFLNIGDDAATSPHTNNTFNIGFAISSTERAWFGISSDNALATSETNRHQLKTSCIGEVDYDDGTTNSLADFVSFGADGFTIDWSNNQSSGDDIAYIAFKGGQYKIGNLTTQTSTGEFSETGVGFQGKAGIFGSFCNAASGSGATGLEMSLGVATASDERFVVGGVSEDAQGTTDTDQFQDDGLMYQNYDHAQTLEGSIDFVSYDADGFTLNQTDADPSANEMIYLIMGSDAVAGGQPTQVRTQGIPTGSGSRDRVGGWN